VDVEEQHMFSNIIPEDIPSEYQRSHTRKDAIIPDMLVHNYYNQGEGGMKVIRAVKKG
jgi:hypothetical protein